MRAYVRTAHDADAVGEPAGGAALLGAGLLHHRPEGLPHVPHAHCVVLPAWMFGCVRMLQCEGGHSRRVDEASNRSHRDTGPVPGGDEDVALGRVPLHAVHHAQRRLRVVAPVEKAPHGQQQGRRRRRVVPLLLPHPRVACCWLPGAQQHGAGVDAVEEDRAAAGPRHQQGRVVRREAHRRQARPRLHVRLQQRHRPQHHGLPLPLLCLQPRQGIHARASVPKDSHDGTERVCWWERWK